MTCSYCGEAPVNHTACYIENLFSHTVDSHISWTVKHSPRFLKNFANWVPILIFNTLAKLNLANFSSDIDKAKTFRSRVVWEEAGRRGIAMEQIFIGKKPIDWYRAKLGSKIIYFESIPIQPEFLDLKQDWDNKIVLKKELLKYNIPVPKYIGISPINFSSLEEIFSKLEKPVIVKPLIGSRARHTVTNINSFEHFKKGIAITRQISPYIVVEEHLNGYICRATMVNKILAGFYRGQVPSVFGDGRKTIKNLIEDKNSQTNNRYHIRIEDELHDHIARLGFTIDDILPEKVSIPLSHRAGQLFGGHTKEMIDELHPSFLPILEKAANIVGLSVIGFDCLIPDPTKPADSQKWGIIECNTLPFIDMHYYALEGKPRNIAGMVWDLWQ